MKHQTEGIVFIKHSLAAFNGSGYADMSSGRAFLDSFRDYNKWKSGRKEQIELTDQYYDRLLPVAEQIVATSRGAGRRPTQKWLDKFAQFRSESKPPENTSLF